MPKPMTDSARFRAEITTVRVSGRTIDRSAKVTGVSEQKQENVREKS